MVRVASNLESERFLSRDPEHRLVAAILERAIHDVVRNYDRVAALTWLQADPDEKTLGPVTGFTFQDICEILDLDRETVLRYVTKAMDEFDKSQVIYLKRLQESPCMTMVLP